MREPEQLQAETAELPAWLNEAAATASGSPALTGSLSAALAMARRRLPYPEEVEELASPEALRRLAERIQQLPGRGSSGRIPGSVLAFAREMPSRQLMLVFPLLAACAQRSELTDRLNAIVRERACASLLRVGYVTFQRNYPHPLLPAAVVAVWQILHIRGIPHEPILQDLIPLTSRSLPARAARKALEQRLPLNRFLAEYRIDPAMPFGARLCAALFHNGDESLFTDNALIFEKTLLQLEPDRQAALLTRFLQLENLPPAVFDQYCQILYDRFGEPDDSDAPYGRFTGPPAAADNPDLYRSSGEPGGSEGTYARAAVPAAHPVWQQVRPVERARFATWVREATIGSHFRDSLNIARFFLRYRRFICAVREPDTETLVIIFPAFTVTHNRRWPDTAMYRSLKDRTENSGLLGENAGSPAAGPSGSLSGTYSDGPSGSFSGTYSTGSSGGFVNGIPIGRPDGHLEISPADPRQPHRLPQEALRQSTTEGQVLLLLDPEGMKQSAVFLEFVLRGGRRHFGK